MGKTSKLVHGNAIDVPQGYFIYFVTFDEHETEIILALYLIKLSKWFTLVYAYHRAFLRKNNGLGLQDVFILEECLIR